MEIIILLGLYGCGKGTILKLLKEAFGVEGITVSSLLGGGRKDGRLIKDDEGVHRKITEHIATLGFFDPDCASKFVFDGVGRTEEQMRLFVRMLADNGLLDERVKFVFLPISDACALLRMQQRYIENLQKGTLRVEEMGTPEEVDEVFRGRISEWRLEWPGIKSTLHREIRGYSSRFITVNGEEYIYDVAMKLTHEIAWNVGAMSLTLAREGLGPTDNQEHERHILPCAAEKDRVFIH